MRMLSFYVVMFLAVPQAWADDPKPGDKAQNLLVIPPWVMDMCGDPPQLKATYDFPAAKQLKEKDNLCNLWKSQAQTLTDQVEGYKHTVTAYTQIIENFEQTRAADQAHIQGLTKQLNTEIAEKNKYKYQPSYGWIWGAAGAVLGLVGVAYGMGASK